MKVVFVVGPTASGKSDWALKQAQKNNGVILNGDSIQCYQRLDIGSAKPTPAEMQLVPHELFSFVPVGEQLTVGDYYRLARETLHKLEQQKVSVVYVVGGTGFYFQALEKGLYPVAGRRPEIYEQLESELDDEGGAEKLYQELQAADPEAAAKISVNDHYRLLRALEVIRGTGESLTAAKEKFAQESAQNKFPYELQKVGLWADREQLLPRVSVRAEKMLQSGLEHEVKQLLDEGFAQWPALDSVGYAQMKQWLQQNKPISESELREQIITATLQLAKKQRTWFKRDPDIQWLYF